MELSGSFFPGALCLRSGTFSSTPSNFVFALLTSELVRLFRTTRDGLSSDPSFVSFMDIVDGPAFDAGWLHPPSPSEATSSCCGFLDGPFEARALDFSACLAEVRDGNAELTPFGSG